MQPFALFFSSLLAAPGSPPPQNAPTIAIVGAKIEVGDGRVLDSGTILLRGDKIVSVGNDPVPSGATIVDAKGLIAYPGFIDAYSTTGVTLPAALPNGTNVPDITNTAPATMWHENRKNIRADVIVADHLSLKGPFDDRYRDGVTTVLVSGGSGTLAGTAALVELADTPKVLVREAAEEIVLAGGGGRSANEAMAGGGQRRNTTADTTPAYTYPLTLFGVFGLMRQTLADAQYYAAQKDAKVEPTYAALRPLVEGQMPGLFTLSNSREIARAKHIANEFRFRMIVNGVPDAYRMVDVLKAESAPVIVPLDLPAEPRRKPLDEDDATPQRVLDDRYALYRERIGNAKTLDEAGIPIAFRSGVGGYLTKIRELVSKSGLARASALRAMTSGPAKIFGVADRLGTLEAGKQANVVLMSGDFLDEKSTVKTTFVDGIAHKALESVK